MLILFLLLKAIHQKVISDNKGETKNAAIILKIRQQQKKAKATSFGRKETFFNEQFGQFLYFFAETIKSEIKTIAGTFFLGLSLIRVALPRVQISLSAKCYRTTVCVSVRMCKFFWVCYVKSVCACGTCV